MPEALRDPLAARALAAADLPAIDFAPARRAGPERIAEPLRRACLDRGFFYLKGHGLPEALVEEAFRQARALFDLPLAAKMDLGQHRSICARGYEPMGGQDLERTGLPDLKEAFDLGVELPMDDPRVVARIVNHGPNQWPIGLPAFRRTMEDYFQAALALSEQLMRALAVSLDLPTDHFASFCHEPVALLRLLHYPPQPVDATEGQKGSGAHTDFGALTLLLQDERGGLQVWDPTHGWLHVPPRPGALVINLGDLIARWTNDRFRSTLHRVVNVSGKERYSIPFFLDGNPNHRIACMPGCLAPGETPRYPAVTVAEHTRAMQRLTSVGSVPA